MLSRVEYCKLLYYGLPNFISKNSANNELCRAFGFLIVTSAPTSSYLKQLHWLPIRQRIIFKILLYVHRFVHQPGKLPLYLSDLMKRNTMVTRSQYFYNLHVPKFRSNFGRRSSSNLVAVERNKLSFELNFIPSEIFFRRKLKTDLS